MVCVNYKSEYESSWEREIQHMELFCFNKTVWLSLLKAYWINAHIRCFSFLIFSKGTLEVYSFLCAKVSCLVCTGVGWLLCRAHPKWMPTFWHILTSSQSVWVWLSFHFLFLSHFNFPFGFVSANYHPSGCIAAATNLFITWVPTCCLILHIYTHTYIHYIDMYIHTHTHTFLYIYIYIYIYIFLIINEIVLFRVNSCFLWFTILIVKEFYGRIPLRQDHAFFFCLLKNKISIVSLLK